MQKIICLVCVFAVFLLVSGCAARPLNEEPPKTSAAQPKAAAAEPASGNTIQSAANALTVTISSTEPAATIQPASSSRPGPALRSAEAVQAIAQAHLRDTPTEWGMEFDGIVSRFAPQGKQLALTLDACGGPTGSGVDTALLDFLTRENIPATLFVSGRWAQQHQKLLKELSENPLFSIQNHGDAHQPLSVTARAAYGIPGTGGVESAMEEILAGERAIQEITGTQTRFFRSGTAHYDDVSVRLLRELGYRTAGFSVNGDGGATFSAAQVKAALLASRPGDIILCHMNRPDKPTGKGLQEVLPELIAQGYEFVRLEDVLPG